MCQVLLTDDHVHYPLHTEHHTTPPPSVNVRAESNVQGCSRDVSCYSRILVSTKSDLSDVVTESLSDVTQMFTSLNPVCVSIDNCFLSLSESNNKKFSETSSQTDFQEDTPSAESSMCKNKSMCDVKLLPTSEATVETQCDLTPTPLLVKHHPDISELCINGSGTVVNQAVCNRVGDSLWVMVEINGSGHIFCWTVDHK
jgi:hypothetical protein